MCVYPIHTHDNTFYLCFLISYYMSILDCYTIFDIRFESSYYLISLVLKNKESSNCYQRSWLKLIKNIESYKFSINMCLNFWIIITIFIDIFFLIVCHRCNVWVWYIKIITTESRKIATKKNAPKSIATIFSRRDW